MIHHADEVPEGRSPGFILTSDKDGNEIVLREGTPEFNAYLKQWNEKKTEKKT